MTCAVFRDDSGVSVQTADSDYGAQIDDAPDHDPEDLAGDAMAAEAQRRELFGTELPEPVTRLRGGDMLWLIAKTCHEANRAYCASIGDLSCKPWDLSSEELRQSAYEGVRRVYEDRSVTAEEMHESWMQYKRDHGWSHGNAKSEELKTHPCMLPYSQLHVQDRAKDAIFLAICKTMFGAD